VDKVKAALYARVSTVDKDQNPEVQLSKLREYCREMGWAVHQEYVDEASAADFLRLERRHIGEGICHGSQG
jgi:DNA invertase Pin-like site-specific DNA recombinase